MGKFTGVGIIGWMMTHTSEASDRAVTVDDSSISRIESADCPPPCPWKDDLRRIMRGLFFSKPCLEKALKLCTDEVVKRLKIFVRFPTHFCY